ncbi:MAG TPA: alpha/beta hydrolase [Spirochaetales bacterium]|nr:alpha/beta hydrolase [Spirochaetales bacterium]HRY53246.1 alpha/beta hydrolase [Spirochaetia bacterium]HRZ65171.1 alpha/beta hydrolase [Spirochaetia bacterium]
MGKAVRTMATALAITLGILVAALATLLALSPGKPRPVLDAEGKVAPGSLSEKLFIEVDGTRQGMYIRSRDPRNPVLLYLHGGMPDYFLEARYPTGLEDIFTVVWWEQRGSGISYVARPEPGSLTLEQLVADTLTLTDYLRGRFGQERIYLMGHSGGTFVAIHAAARAPEKYRAYIGVAQIADQLESELRAYGYLVAAYRERGDERMLRKLEAVPVTREGGLPKGYSALLRDVAMHELGVGTMRGMRSILGGLVLPSLAFREYTLAEKYRFWTAKAKSGISVVWGEVLSADLARELPRLELPVYFFEGAYDYTCAYSVAREYYDRLEAPLKGFYTFPDSAHSPIFEEPERSLRILREDVLGGANGLSD